MVEVWLPYGKTEVCARIPTTNFFGTIEPKEVPGVADPKAEIERALKEPIGTEPLSKIAKPSDRVAIVVDDASRSTPSYLMVPILLKELNSAGVKDENITVIFACGTQRPAEPEEMKRLLGEEILQRVKAVNHDCKAEDQVFLGTTSFGTKVYVNKLFAEADLKILTGDVQLHFFAGYGGGRKSILPGISSMETVKNNHSMVLQPTAKTGVLEGNPIHADMVEAAKLAEVDFILNIVANGNGEIVKAFAGDLEQAFYEGTKLVDEIYKVPVEGRMKIVLVSAGGYPHDLDLYNAYKALDSALNVVKKGGVVILVAECPEGHGHEVFYEWMIKFKDPESMEKELKKNFIIGGHKAYFLKKALQNVKIILVSIMPDYYVMNTFGLRATRAVNDALQEAFEVAGKNSRVWVMPHGNITLPIVKTPE